MRRDVVPNHDRQDGSRRQGQGLYPSDVAATPLGKASWWLRRWLDRLLPRINVEGRAMNVDDLDDLVREPVTTGV
jgi:hypothetical protein